MRDRAKKMGYKLNEYGLFKGDFPVRCRDEKAIFNALGLSDIPPELRENLGEIEAAERGEIPELVEEDDVRGVFHVHTDFSDGMASLADMVARAESMGFEYVGISDHSRSARYANGLDVKRVKGQEKLVEKLRKKRRIRIFRGIESDILADGSLDYPDDVLERFDFVIASVHSRMKMTESQMTERIVTALKNPFATILGHATGRLLLARARAVRRGLERRHPRGRRSWQGDRTQRQPAPFRYRLAVGPYLKQQGVKVCINPDAHSVPGLENYRYGVWLARKGWLEKKDVLNVMSTKGIENYLRH